MNKLNIYLIITLFAVGIFFFGNSINVHANDEPSRPEGTTCEVNGIEIDCDSPAIEIGPNCPYLHYHGTLNGVPDPDPTACGHGMVLSVAPKEETKEVEKAPSTEVEKAPSTWSKIADWFDALFQGITGGFSPKNVSDSVDIVEDATPSIKETADNAEEYFDAYEDAPDRDRYTLEDENPEENAPAPSLYRWFWGWFE